MFPLKNVLYLNAASCIAFGLLFATGPNATAHFLSDENNAPAWIISVLGYALIGNGILLIWTARQDTPPTPLIIHFSLGDFAWTIGTIALIVSKIWITTMHGIACASVIGLFVAAMGLLQLRALHLRALQLRS